MDDYGPASDMAMGSSTHGGLRFYTSRIRQFDAFISDLILPEPYIFANNVAYRSKSQ